MYNLFLEERKKSWENNKKSIGVYDQCNKLPELKKVYPDLREVHSQVLQNVAIRLDLAFYAFFQRIKRGDKPGYPRFKSKYRYNSFTYPQFDKEKIDLQRNKITLPKIGDIYIELHRKIEGKIKTVTIQKSSTGKYYLILSCSDIERQEFSQKEEKIGIDVGIISFATFSNGEKILNPRFFETEQKELAKKQRKIQKAKDSGGEVKKNYQVAAKVHERINNKRNDFLHQESLKLVKRFKTICVEDIEINSLIKKRWCNKQILDAAWGKFLQDLTYKAEYAGCKLIKVNPAYTSQTCSTCGTRTVHELKDRVFHCSCGFELDRDENAAKNILRIGLDSLA